MDDELAALNTTVQGLRHVIYGNGETGVTERVRDLQRSVEALKLDVHEVRLKVDALEDARARDENLREGGRRTLVAIGAILTILSGAGAAVSVRVLQTLAELAQALP